MFISHCFSLFAVSLWRMRMLMVMTVTSQWTLAPPLGQILTTFWTCLCGVWPRRRLRNSSSRKTWRYHSYSHQCYIQWFISVFIHLIWLNFVTVMLYQVWSNVGTFFLKESRKKVNSVIIYFIIRINNIRANFRDDATGTSSEQLQIETIIQYLYRLPNL